MGTGGRGERGARWGLWGEGEVDVGRRWRAWRRRGPHHCSPCFLAAKPGSTALRLVVDYDAVDKKA